MCGRFTLTADDLAEVAVQVSAHVAPENLRRHRPRFNVAPNSRHWIVRAEANRREFVPATWGLVPAWRQAAGTGIGVRPFNARAETVAEKSLFRAAFRSRRCVVPVDGFFEWRGARAAREPVWFHAPDRSLLWFAGIHEQRANPETGGVESSFAVLTTQANALVATVHDRMPVLLDPSGIETWLGSTTHAKELRGLLRPAPLESLEFHPVSRRVNDVREDDPTLIEPIRGSAMSTQVSLFR